MYTKAFLLCLMVLRKNNQKRDGEIGERKLNEMRALNMK